MFSDLMGSVYIKKLYSLNQTMTRRHSSYKTFSEEIKCPHTKAVSDEKAKATMTSSDEHTDDVTKTNQCCCPKRWVLAFALLMMRLCHAAMRQNIGIALVCMTHTADEITDEFENVTSSPSNATNCKYAMNVTTEEFTNLNSTEFNWSSMFEGQVLSAPYYGFLLVIPLAGYLDHAMGSCRLLMMSLTVGGLLSLLTPFLTRQHRYFLVASRALTGAANGVVKPAVFTIWANWAPVTQRGMLTSVEYSGSAVGGIVTFFISGFLCSIPLDHGWPFVFYVIGALSMLCAVAMGMFVYDRPDQHPTISHEEFKFITSNQHHEIRKGKVRPPWSKIIRCPAVWAIIVAHTSHHWVFAAIVGYLPMYMRDVLQYKIAENGMLSALPFVGSMIAGLAGGIVADKMHRCISIASVRKIFQVTGSWGFAIPMLVVTWLMDINHRLIAVMLLVLAVTLLNLTSLAYRINCLDIAPRYASFITSLSFTIATAASLTAPVVTSAILVEKSNEEWKIVLYIVSAVSFAGGLFYLFFARGEVQSWALENTFDITVIVPDPAPAAAIQRERSVSDFMVDKDRDACLVLSVNPLNSLQ